MSKLGLLVICLFCVPFALHGQMQLISFDTIPDTTFMTVDGGPALDVTYTKVELETTNKNEGTGALRVDWKDRCWDQYGGWIGLNFFHPDSLGLWDFSPYTELTLWYYIEKKASVPNNEVHFRIILYDVGAGASFADGQQEVWLSHHLILEAEPGWNQIVVKLEDGGDAVASWMPDVGKAFWNPRWGQNATGNQILDLDRIHGWRFEISQEANLYQKEVDWITGTMLLDNLSLQGARPISLVMFNGKSLPSDVSMFVGWSGTAAVTNEEAYVPGTNSVKWVAGSGWDGINFQFAQPKNLVFNWETDSVQFKIKTMAGLGDLNLTFHDVDEDGAIKTDYPFQATYLISEASMGYDGTWKKVKVALKDFNRNNGCWDNDLGAAAQGTFDFTRLEKFTIGGFGQSFEGKVVYLDDIWTGNPVFDWVPPAVVTNVGAVPSKYYNLVIWEDVKGEASELYNVYASEKPITDMTAPGVEKIETGIIENTQTAVHWLKYPLADKEVTWYYAVECVDASGNVGPAGVSGAIMNVAKATPTISLNPPPDFKADADLSEWEANGNMPWILKPETDHVSTGTVSDSTDLKAKIYIAMDNDYLYIAIDVVDDIYSFSTEGDWFKWDALELFLGLYDQRGAAHAASPWSNRGTEPDYKFVCQYDRFFNEFRDGGMEYDIMYTNADDNYEFVDFGGSDYACEVKVPLNDLRIGTDYLFTPKNGMKIPIEITFHDNDGTTVGDWQGNLTLSTKDDDNAWQWPWQWTYTWLGDTTMITAVEHGNNQIQVQNYRLDQNYPNPFNPNTSLTYAVPEPGQVKIEIYNMLGEKVLTLVDGFRSAGIYKLDINAAKLPSGVYFYTMQAGKFVQSRKMILMK